MRWEDFSMLYALWILVPIGLVLLWLLKRKEIMLRRMFEEQALDAAVPLRNKNAGRIRVFLLLAAMACCVIALARPKWGYSLEKVKRRSMEIMVLLDTSNSMRAQDVKPNRLEQAKLGIKDLVRQLKGDRIGLIAFAGGSFLQCPLTVDYAAFNMTLDDIYPGIIRQGGTRITQALETALKSFDSDTQADRAIILITDGEDHEGNPLELMPTLKEQGIRVYTIGVGTRFGELIPAVDKEKGAFLKNREGEVVKTALQDELLKKMALATGGAYVQTAAGDFGMDRLMEEHLSQLKRTEEEAKTIKSYEERFTLALLAALVLLFAEAFVKDTKRPVKRSS